LHTCWHLLLEEYGITFDYLPRNKNVDTVADTLTRLDIDSPKIQEEEALTLLSGSESNSISNIKFPMHTALIFNEQAKVKEPELREKSLAQPHYSLQILKEFIVFTTTKDLYSSIIETNNKEYCSGIMNIYFIRDRQKQKRLSGIP
jgi:hypothetical protein